MFQFIPLLLLQCVQLIGGENAVEQDSSIMRGVMMCRSWCTRRNWCPRATCNLSIECSTGSETPLPTGQTGIPVPQHLCETCPPHLACVRTRTGATKCVEKGSHRKAIEGKTTSDDKKTGLGVNCKGRAKSCAQRLRQGRTNKKTDCTGQKIYVDMHMNYVRMNAVHFSIFAKCKNEKRTHSVVGFKERKIYYWMMTLRSRVQPAGLSFQLAVTNQNRETGSHLKHAKVFKGITITVGEHITFKSGEVTRTQAKLRRRRHQRYLVVLDKINGRMLLGTGKYCLAVQDSIDVRDTLYPVVVHSSMIVAATTGDLIWFYSKRRKRVTDEDVGNLIRRCDSSKVLQHSAQRQTIELS